jgi:hypothetical protein
MSPAMRRLVVGLSVSYLASLSSFQTASAVNIILNFNAAQSEFPSFDPSAAGLISIFEFAEDLWEDIFEDSHTVTINFWYEDLSGGTAALHTLVADDGTRETEADIRVDTILNGVERPWFIDPTPEDNSEFNMSQTLWRDLTATQQSNFFNVGPGSTVPDTLEIGYTGTAIAGGAADNLWDMVTSVTHEVGYALG